jgi:hypothetical protein
LLPTAHEESKVHFPQARPPAPFRLQGLVTLLTAYALRSRAGFVSHRQRSWDLPFGAFTSRKVSGGITARMDPHRFACRHSHRRSDEPARLSRGSWVSTLPRVPRRLSRGLVHRPLGAPLGFSLSGLAIESLTQAFARVPLTRLANLTITRPTRRRPRVSIGLRPASPVTDAEAPSPEKRPS